MTSALAEVLEKLERATPGKWPEPEPSRFMTTHFSVGDQPPYMLVSRNECDLRAAVAAVNFLREHGPALLASQQYAEANPLGGPASMLETAARRIRAGEDFHEVLADYDLHSGAALLRDAGDGWLPIESAPRDGERIILGRPDIEGDGGISVAGYWLEELEDGVDYMGNDGGFTDVDFQVFQPGRSFGAESYRYAGSQPTHWRPLPQPPAMHAPGGATGPTRSG